jgi:hypothetical protein
VIRAPSISVLGLSWILLLVPGATACVDSTGAGSGPSAIRLQSDPGDSVGAGKTYTYTQANAVIGVEAVGVPTSLTVTVLGDESWIGYFTMPSGVTRLEPGTYGATLNWRGGSFGYYGCSTVTGSFTVDRVSYDSTRVTAIDLSFEQRCNGAAAALHGTIHWRADDPTRAPGPVNPPPANLWSPPAGATPAGVNFVYVQSDSGDFVGQGQTHLYTPATATIDLIGDIRHVFVSVTDSGTSSGDFFGMNSIPKLAVGYYGGLQSLLFMNPTKGGLSWGVCAVLTGWFVIDRVTYTANTVTAIDVRFEQHCQASPTAALRGAIHWAR